MKKRSVLLIGGARSGKSSFAEEMARQVGGEVLFVATAEARDEEMRRRIEVHQKSRPAHWYTLEAPCRVGSCISQDGHNLSVVVLDCITLLVNNILCQHMAVHGEDVDEKAVENDVKTEISAIIDCIHQSSATYILVTNEVGEGIIPLGASTRIYRDVLGRANQMLARAVDEVYLMVAGIPLRVKPQGQSYFDNR
ncbi:bifunctional adenosylcobinamide kinase/adenosylcobinamide-phosphate guanylyltransferase [Dehalogenimonas alkenigignens]|uniref:Adenosylcobinamide kinase n=1 Tax=Dehalogenimonas alkenigignens TaxID=1217799 RepID=A0A0W0GJ52_9CHLR|nr:bifunctional adenosylcobinamide kinase/adenosylcobinamide-phosphate guanylyltransferase [Dehalogenimonas alkenigignens]KTB48601.1 adenosylcobinamide kinase/adenosylcobinamide-phosphate guanylyltransferase [Dehalogenimonas alkenigignens]PVV84960.1 bifunctional adenosylcobinamide kinase/adenosylcobinamide-phosphate guanylyltransferase [Dehalogenimonas alkenigignens]